MNCREAADLITRRSLGTLEGEPLEEHLTDCAACTRAAAGADRLAVELRDALAGLRPAVREPARDASPRRLSRAALAAAAILWIGTFVALLLPGAQEKSPVRLPSSPTYSIEVAGDAEGILLHDLNKDGFPDLIIAVNEGGREAPSVMYLSTKGRFEKVSWTPEDPGVNAGLGAADLDGDGDDDLVISRYNHQPAVAYRNLGGGKLETKPFWTSADQEWAYHVVVGDFDGDGHADIFADDRIYHGGREGPNPTYDWKVDGKYNVSRKVWADVDGDGPKDIVISSWVQGPAYEVLRGLEKDFDKKASSASKLKGEFSALAIGDINGDGYPEIFVGALIQRNGDGRVRMYANARGKPAAEPSWMSDDVDCDCHDLVLADFDNDGDLDLFVLAEDHTSVFENRRGRLESQPCWRSTVRGQRVLAADLDRNGWVDLVVADEGKVDVFMGGPEISTPKPGPFPTIPRLPALTRRDFLPDADPAAEALLDEYRKTGTVSAAMRDRAAMILSAIESLEAKDLVPLAAELRPRAEEQVDRLIGRLKDESVLVRDDAERDLVSCGRSAMPRLEKAGASPDAEVVSRSASARGRIERGLRYQEPEAVEVLGMKLARLTPRLKRRYGHADVEGVVVLEIPEALGPDLGLTNIREGDVILGIGPLGDYGERIDLAGTPLEMLSLILKHDEEGEKKNRGWLLAGYRYVCGPLHPTYRGTVRQHRMDLTPSQWAAIKEAVKSPRRWTPEK